MSPRIFESPFTWLSLTGISVPPRNPNNNNDEDEEDEDEDEEDDKREPRYSRAGAIHEADHCVERGRASVARRTVATRWLRCGLSCG